MDNIVQMMMGAAGAAEPTDPYFNQTVLLLHGDGTNGAQNNTFLDSSTNNFTITRNGNTTQGTFSPFSAPDGYWGNYFDGTDDYLSVADNAVLRPGAGAFTLEAWVYRNAAGAAHTIYAKGGASTGINFQITSGNVLRFTHTTTNIDSTGTVAANAWVHVAVVREGTGTNQTKLYINGTQDGQGTVSTDFTQTEEVRIGTNRSAGDDFAGYISNVRFVKGSALYIGNFTPSTTPFTTTSQGASSSEVELLTCQSNRFVDNSTNAFAITVNGNTSVQPFSPFLPSAEYDSSVNGGSGYFDGTGDYLSLTGTSLGSGNFTLEFWVYLPTSGINVFFDSRTSDVSSEGFAVYRNSSNYLSIFTDGTGTAGTTVIPTNQWVHLALVRNSNTIYGYMNGVQQFTRANSATMSLTSWKIFAQYNNTNLPTGYLSNFRITTTAVYTAAFTPPTAPLTDITNTELLCNFTNAGIFDNTGKNNLETVGNAQIDTTTKKYGTGSMEFDGTGDYLVQPTNENYGYGTGDFTIEFWLYLNITTTQTIFSNLTSASSINPHIYIDGTIRYYTDNADRITGSSLSTGQWYYIALVKSSGSTKLYIDGTQSGSTYTDSNNYGTTAPLGIGTYWSSGSPVTTQTLNGFIDDLRITKGVARYTAAFTPPTEAFPNL